MGKRSIFILVVVFSMQYVFAAAPSIFHIELESVEVGEKARFEFNMVGIEADIFEARLFYRAVGSSDFQSQKLHEQGYTLSAEIETKNLPAGKIEYYLAMQTITGDVITYPEISPEQNPNTFNLVASSDSRVYQNAEQLLVLSPEPDEIIPEDEFLVAVSIPNEDADVDHSKTRLLIDGINVSSMLDRDGNVYTFAPDNMRTGPHNAEFKIFNSSGDLLAKEEWSYRISGGGANVSEFRQTTNIFLDNRFQNISENSDNYFKAGFIWNSAYSGWDFKLKGLTGNDEGYSGQSPTRIGAYMAYNLSPQSKFYLKGGDFTGDYEQLSFWNRRILGFAVGFNLPWMDFDLTMGSTSNAVEGELTFTPLPTDNTIAKNIVNKTGTFEESFLAIRPVFNFGDHVKWGLNLINSRQDPKSINTDSRVLKTISATGDTLSRLYTKASNPKESLSVGTTLNLNFDNNRIRFAGSFQGSFVNNDATTELTVDSLASLLDLSKKDKSNLETAAGFLDPFLTLSPGLAIDTDYRELFGANLAMQFDTYINYFDNYFKITYKNIENGYTTAGNPYLQRGIRGLYINDNIRLFNNQLFLNLYFNTYDDNLGQEGNETSNNSLGASVSYFPLADYPGITVSYGNTTRNNDYNLGVTNVYDPFLADSTQTTSPEDNTTQSLSVSSNYSFLTGSVKNTATISVSNSSRDDKIKTVFAPDSNGVQLISTSASSFTIFSLALRNTYSIPVVTRFGFSQTSSTLGKGGSNPLENTDLRFYGGVEYLVTKFVADMNFKPFLNFSIAQSDISDRTNYTAGFYINSFSYGNLSLRFDMIDFGSDVDYSDKILSTRYDVTF